MYSMHLVTLLVPFIAYCVIMYAYKLNMRDKKNDLFAYDIVFLLPTLIYLIILFVVNICKPLRFPGTQR